MNANDAGTGGLIRSSSGMNSTITARPFGANPAVAEGRTEESGVFVGEAIGLMRDVSPASEILARVSKEAEVLLRERATALVK
jgi:hypothetical protein